jgi:pilus assembly protein CpaF
MSGLLKQLQKQKSGQPHEATNPVLRPSTIQESDAKTGAIFTLDHVAEEPSSQARIPIPPPPSAPSSPQLKDGHPTPPMIQRESSSLKSLSRDKLLQEKIVLSAPAEAKEKKQTPFVHDSPPWISEEKKTNPQVDMLITTARQMLIDAFPDNAEDMDVIDSVKKAVAFAADDLQEDVRLTRRIIDQAETELTELLDGKGPLRPLFEDPGVTDIFVDNHKSVKVIRRGRAMETPFSFRCAEEYKLFLTAMLQTVGRVLNTSSPIVDCVLDDVWRSRVNALDSSIVEGSEPRISIRVPRSRKITFYDILHTKTLPPTLASWLTEVVAQGEANILVIGPESSGKTSMTTALLSSVGSDERITVIEQIPEIFVPTTNIEKLIARPASAQGDAEVTIADLLKISLRRSPHRIVLGEIQGEDACLFLRALESGHSGSIAELHADSSVNALWHLLDLVAAHESAPQESIMRRLCRSVHLAITMKNVDGGPCVAEVAEVKKPSGFDFEVQPLVTYKGLVNGKRQWQIGTQHSFWLDRIAEQGCVLMPGPGLILAEEDNSSKDNKGK